MRYSYVRDLWWLISIKKYDHLLIKGANQPKIKKIDKKYDENEMKWEMRSTR